MQLKIFTIPAFGGEALQEDLNRFLANHKILQVEKAFSPGPQGGTWSFCISYLEGKEDPRKRRKKVDYKEVLSPEVFGRFSKLRQIRLRLAKEEGIPAFAVLIDEDLVKMAEMEKVTLASLAKIPGIGPQKVEKYGKYFVSPLENETSQSPDGANL